MVRVIGLVTVLTATSPCIATLLRVVDKALLLTLIYAIDNVIVFDGLSFVFLYIFGFGPVSVVWAYFIGYLITIIVASVIIFRFDWRRIPTVDK